MNRDKVQLRVGLLVVFLAGVSFFSFLVDRMVFRKADYLSILLDPTLSVLLFSLIFFSVSMQVHSNLGRLMFSLGFFSLSGPLIFFNGPSSYFGLALIIVGTILFHRFGFLERNLLYKTLGIFAWSAMWVFLGTGYVGETPATGTSTIVFLGINLVMLYILFEEEIRELVASNKVKDAEIAEKDAEIARLEPLSVLGERVAHVAHSFKNNLNQVSTALFLLEQLKDHTRAAEKLREFSHTLNERIENILMVSRAGVDLEPEVFDVARVLEGMHQVYLQERTFLERVKTKITLEGPVLVHAVRWDFILLVENILKNALEAIVDAKGQGFIRIDLARGLLTIANDGGPIPLCAHCNDDCNHCQRYGRPGQTTKAGGSGHGLAQVMATCRNNGWNLRIRTHEEWTIFEVRFPHGLD